MDKIIGRLAEISTLESMCRSDKAEFLAIYGRRRIGKTMLIRTFFRNQKDVIFLNTTGTFNGKLVEQLNNFIVQVGDTFYKGARLRDEKNWHDAFQLLTEAIKSFSANKKIILFFDEFPWMATKNSRLLQNLDYFWNQYWSNDPRIKLIICGSSASWIIKKIIKNKGGLHNRITRTIHLEPYTLKETQQYLRYQGHKLNHQQIVELYMVLGGIPYYLSYLEKGLSAAQNIENLAFKRNGFLLTEFENLFSALFDDSESYINIIRIIAKHRYGIEQKVLFTALKDFSKGGRGLEKLQALEDANFIIKFKPHLSQKKGIYYKVIDEYTLFYFHWLEPLKETLLIRGMQTNYWQSIYNTPEWYSWSGYAFEAICYKHLAQIADQLQLAPTAIPNTWRYSPPKSSAEFGAQIDLLFDRKDNAITLCEIKYTAKPFELTKAYAAELKNKILIFQQKTKITKQIFIALITANGLKQNYYSEELIDGLVTMDDFFN